MKEKKKENLNGVFKIFEVILTILLILTLGIFSYSLFKINVVPTKYLIVGYVVIFLISLLMIWFLFQKKRKILKGIAVICLLASSILFSLGTLFLNNTYHFLKGTQAKYNIISYSVVVLKENHYENLESLKDKKISYIEKDHQEEIQKELSQKISYQEVLISDFSTLITSFLEKEVDSIVLEASYLTLAIEEMDNFEDSIQVIYTFEIKEEIMEEESQVEPTPTPEEEQNEVSDKIQATPNTFILYISGIDQYGNVNTVRGRSDVNQLAIVNLNTNHILLVNTPRDYYVQLAGTTGLKDKLTHAGIYGINKSVETLENFYGIDINYYLRVNFNTLIKVIDEIGGIDIYSDSSFRCWTNSKVYVNKGWNHFNGTQALAYSRERKSYATGDHHRGANQQQVITAIIDKVSSSKILVSKYNNILNSLNGSFQTSMPMNNITDLIKHQLDQMPSWNVESIAVTGYNSKNYTYSMGRNYLLYVMEPDYDSVATVKNRIREVLNEK